MKFNEIIQSEKPVLIDFFATWCGPCQAMPPILKELKSKLGDKVSVLKIDVDKNQQLANKYGVRSVPTLMLFKRGELVWRESGVFSAQQLAGIINQHG
jgi:thioredoxin 1